jgi:thiol-disulfide isomerase/thioredoxin
MAYLKPLSVIAFMLVLLLPQLSSGETIKDVMTPEGQLDVSQYAGKVVYVDFWASWCEPCRSAFSWMNQMHDRYYDRGLVILAVNLDRNREDAEAFLAEATPRFSILFDEGARMAKAYDLEGMPTSFIYDARGKLAETRTGFRKRDQLDLENMIRELLPSSGDGASR